MKESRRISWPVCQDEFTVKNDAEREIKKKTLTMGPGGPCCPCGPLLPGRP